MQKLQIISVQIVDEKQMLRILQGTSNILKQKELKQRQLQLPKQIANLNRIKQDNERIFKSRISYLQDKMMKIQKGENLIVYQKKQKITPQYIAIIQNKNKEIIEYKNKLNTSLQSIQKLKHQIEQLKLQNIRLQMFIRKHQSRIESQIKQSQLLKQAKPQSKINKTPKTQLRFHSNLVQVKIIGTRKNQHQNKSIQITQQLLAQIKILQGSNSALRKQMLQIHTYMQHQDERYQKNIQNLQDKIKRLLQFNSNSKSRIHNNDCSFQHDSLKQINFSQSSSKHSARRERHSDMMPRYALQKTQNDKQQKSKLVQLADLSIKFELNKLQQTPKQSKFGDYSQMTTLSQSRTYYTKQK